MDWVFVDWQYSKRDGFTLIVAKHIGTVLAVCLVYWFGLWKRKSVWKCGIEVLLKRKCMCVILHHWNYHGTRAINSLVSTQTMCHGAHINELHLSICHQEFQFANFIATKLHPAKVIALHPQFCTARQLRHLNLVNWSWKLTQHHPGVACTD